MNRRRHNEEQDRGFARKARHMLLAWIALIALLLLSLGSAYLSLGALNPVLSLTIAALKTAIVVWLFMQMKDASPLVRITAASGLATLALLVGLSGVDYATRAVEDATVQQPQQLPSLYRAIESVFGLGNRK